MNYKLPSFLFLLLLYHLPLMSQQITGVWKGRMGSGLKQKKVELKLIKKGDSLVGTSYYYESANNFKRYSVKGYFDQETNAAVWWDEELISSKSPRIKILSPGEIPFMAEADFNCPGDGVMMLDGKAKPRDNEEGADLKLHFDKVSQAVFEDEWDFVIDNYTVGASDPAVIDSVAAIAFTPVTKPVVVSMSSPKAPEPEKPVVVTPVPAPPPSSPPITEIPPVKPVISKTPAPQPRPKVVVQPAPLPPPSIEDKFASRKKILATEIPVGQTDSIELRFYDNAEVDGDSISLFLNNKLVFSHIRLSDKPYIIKLGGDQLANGNELTMVAENLGAIPPNTSYMVVFINEQRYEATLSSTEQSSAVIRFTKK